MTDREYQALVRMAKSLDDPRSTVYLVLLEARAPVTRKKLLSVTGLHDWTLDRAVRSLLKDKLVGRLRCEGEVHLFPIL